MELNQLSSPEKFEQN